MRLGGVLVMTSTESAAISPQTMPAPMPVMRAASGAAMTQPRMPPAPASAGMPSEASGMPSSTWQRPATAVSSIARPDADAAVVAHRCGVAEHPQRQQHEHHRQRDRDLPEEAAERVGGDRLRDLARGQDPLDDGTGDREQREQEGHAVAPLVLGERLAAEDARGGAGRVREPHPRALPDAGTVVLEGRLRCGLTRALHLGGRGRLPLRGRRAGCGTIRGCAGRARARRLGGGHADTLIAGADAAPEALRRQKRMASITFERTAIVAGMLPASAPTAAETSSPVTAAPIGNPGSTTPPMPCVSVSCTIGSR